MSTSKSKKVVKQKVIEEPKEVQEQEQDSVTEKISNDEHVSIEVDIKNAMKTIETYISSLKVIKQDMKRILTTYQKEIKELKKNSKKTKKPRKENYVPHGFTKAVPASASLLSFLGYKSDELVARPTVTKHIAKYVKENKLADEKDGSIFRADKKLKSLLGEPKHLINSKKPELGIGYSYKNLQTYLSPHFNLA